MLVRIQYLQRSVLCLNLTNIITHTLEQRVKKKKKENAFNYTLRRKKNA